MTEHKAVYADGKRDEVTMAAGLPIDLMDARGVKYAIIKWYSQVEMGDVIKVEAVVLPMIPVADDT